MKTLKSAFITSIAMLCALGGHAKELTLSDAYRFEHITVADGLPHNFVDDILIDSRGYAWLGLAGGGLARYDGYGFTSFDMSTPQRHIPDNFVRRLAEDAQHRLWVATDNGLCCISILDHSLQPLPDNMSQLASTPIYSVAIDSKGRLWVNTPDKHLCFDGDKRWELPVGTGHLNSAATIDVNADGSMWTSHNGRVCRLTPTDGASMTVDTLRIQLPPEAIVSDIITVGEDVWIATNGGLVRHNRSSDRDRLYVHDDNDPNSLSQNFVTSLVLTPDNRLVASTLLGLNIYNSLSDNFTRQMADGGNNALGNNFVNCMLTDGDNIWIGTESGGLNLLTPIHLGYRFYSHDPADPASLSPNPVNAIHQDPEGRIWVGTVEGGLNRLADGAFEHFSYADGVLTHNTASAIASDNRGRLWVGTWGGGVNVVDRDNPSRPLMTITTMPDGMEHAYIGALLYDPANNGMWIGSNMGVYFYDLATDRVVMPFEPTVRQISGAVGAAIDHDGMLWVVGSNGLLKVDTRRRVDGLFDAVLLTNSLDDPTLPARLRTTAVTVAADGTLWIGTDTNGLYYKLPDSDAFVNLGVADGLPHFSVKGIVEAPDHCIWVSTAYKGLARYNPATASFVNYTKAQGLPSDEYFWAAYASDAQGNVYFGSTDGLVEISPAATDHAQRSHTVRFSAVTVSDLAVPIATADDGSQYIEMHESDKSISIDFSALDYARDPGCTYSYMLAGFDKDWTTLPPDRHFVTYTNLPPGRYTLKVRYGTGDDAPVSELKIHVAAYFYHQWWFYVICLLAAAAIIWWAVRRRVRAVNNQKRQLQAAVDERTHELSEQKRTLELQTATLAEQTKALESQTQALEERNRRIQELTVDRLQFFTNLTHEFRTPITLILGPVQRAIKLTPDSPAAEQLRYAERNARYLLDLVNQLLDFRKIESGKLEIRRTTGDFPAFVHDVVESFRTLTAPRGIALSCFTHMRTPIINFDKDAMRKLLNNFLGNAVKYTPDGGSIDVCVAQVPARCAGAQVDQLYIVVRDSGDGINPDDLDQVFDRYYQGNTSIKYPTTASSTGIGLHLCKCIVEAYGGSISAKNNPRGGASFRVLLPMAGADSADSAVPVPVSQTPDNPEADRQRMTILVVDDNKDMLLYVGQLLSARFNVVQANGGAEALQVLQSQDIDFIVCDFMMPDIDGLELSRRVRQNLAMSHIPFVMLTANASEVARLESYRSGVDDYILKPFDEEMLLARIDNIIEKKRRYQRQFAIDGNVDDIVVSDLSPDKKFLANVMQVIKDNYKNSYFEVGDFAEALGVSRSFLNKKLQSLVGQSPSQMVRTYRLSIAREMIIQNRSTHALTISEIAYDVGFNDSKYFTRCFTKEYNIAPSALYKNEEAEK